ncbi:MAG: hypothetical protein NTNFB02_28410 [Nitrospira sp.]
MTIGHYHSSLSPLMPEARAYDPGYKGRGKEHNSAGDRPLTRAHRWCGASYKRNEADQHGQHSM